jgi:hypothetical protein
VLGDAFEKAERLGRQPMPAPGTTVEPIESPDGFDGVSEFNLKPGVSRLSNAAPDGAIQSLVDRIFPSGEIDRVTVES